MTTETSSDRSLRTNLLAGFTLVGGLVVGFGGWAATTEFAGAVVTQGQLVVDGNVKKVQHPTGGVIGGLAVREGDRVEIGAVVARLDDTLARANVGIARKSLADLLARRARLAAERDGASEMSDPPETVVAIDDADLRQAVENERKVFAKRRAARLGQTEQLRQRILQLREEMEGQKAHREARGRELELVVQELDGVRTLYEKNLVQLPRLVALQREQARLLGERAQLVSATAQTQGRITEIEMQIGQIEADLASEVARDTKETDGRIGEVVERLSAAEDSLKRVDIRAPQSGVVHQLAVHTVGGVVGPGEALMIVVPDAGDLAIEAKVSPTEIDRLRIGQPAGLRFSAFNARTTPEIAGRVSYVSPDVTIDQRSGATYYTVRVKADAGEIARLGDVHLSAGMPVEVFAATDERTVLSYFMKPLTDQVVRAFREK